MPRRGRAAGVTGVDLELLKEVGRKITYYPEELHAAQDHRSHHGRPPQDDRGRPGHRLGDRRVARLRHAARSRAFASGCRARTCERGTFSQRHSVLMDQVNEKKYTPLKHIAKDAGRVRGDQLHAVGGGRARLRIWLQPRRAECAGAVGSAVRRFRQRRAGDHRPVHLLRRAQMAAHVGPRAAAAAWL